MPSDDAACASLGDSRTNEQGPTYYSAMALECARNQAMVAGDPALAARSAYRLARVWLNFSRRSAEHRAEALATARGIAVAALAPAGRIADRAVRVALTGRLAEAALDAGQGADSALQQAVDTMQAASVEAADHAATHALRARLALMSGNRDAALRDVRQAILLEQQVQGVPWRLADWDVLLAAADPAGRLAHLASALRALDAVRPLLAQTDTLTEDANFVLRIRPVFEAAIGAELDGSDGDSAEPITRVQGQVETYRQAELQSLLGSECVRSRPPIRPEDLRAGEVLLYPVLLPDRIELIYASGDEAGHASYHRLPPIRGTGRAEVLSLVDSLTDGTSLRSDNDWRGPARRLYALLIAPVERLLKPGGTLVVVPDGQLSALPFAALLDSRDAFLVQRSKLAVVPSLAFAQLAERSWRQPVVLAVTLERAVVMPAGTFKALTGTANEAQVAVGPTTRADRLIRNFRRADLERALSRGGIDILHVATHADFNGRSDRSYIVADGETVPIGDLRAMIARSETRGNQLDLIVLSACETAVGDDQADMGLAGAAVQAGARSAVASLWSVNDLGTTELMRGFYAALRKGEGKAQALHEAQLALIARGDEFSDPNVWAAFTLLGDWR
jgi:CHAT domain-containing protein